jgi:hypothetical protein
MNIARSFYVISWMGIGWDTGCPIPPSSNPFVVTDIKRFGIDRVNSWI